MATPPQRTSREIRAGRINRRPPSLAVTLVALAIVFALAWMIFVRSGPSASAPVVQGIEGTYAWEPIVPGDSGVPRETGSFSAVGSGDAGGRMAGENTAPRAGTSGSADSAYDAASRTTTTDSTWTSPLGERTERTIVVGAWPPAWRLATRSPLDYQGLAAVVRAAVEDGDDAVGVKPGKDGDRAAWRAAMTLEGKQVNVVVDQLTGIVTWYSDDEATFTASVDWSSPPAGTTYSVAVPDAVEVKTIAGAPDYATSPTEAGRAAGYRPLVSDLAPDGFALRAVATSRAGHLPADWLGLADEVSHAPVRPPGRAILQLYTRGLSWFSLEQVGPETVRRMPELADWVAQAAARSLSYQETTLQYGALKGATASTWYQASGPSLFVAGKRRAVLVTGALTRQELIAFAEGLEPIPAKAGP